MKQLIPKLKGPFQIVRVICRYQPSYIWWSLPQMVMQAVLPILSVYAPKLIIEKLTDGSSYPSVAGVIVSYCMVLLILKVAGDFFLGKSKLAADRFARRLRFEIGKMTMNFRISNLEAASHRELVHMANNAAKLTETFGLVQQMISNMVTISGLVAIAVRLDFIFLVAIAVVFAVKTLFMYLQFSYGRKVRDEDAKQNRIGDYLYGLVYSNHGAEKEIRLNNLESWLMGKIKHFREEMLRKQYMQFRMSTLFEILMSVLMAAESFAVLMLLSDQYLAGSIAIADFTMYFSTVTSLTSALTSFTHQVRNYQDQVLNIRDYEKLMKIFEEENNGVVGEAIHIGSLTDVKIVFHNVSFVYPGCDQKALDHINLTIKDQEKLVIVGLNGSGKTTLIKLLCKFYPPTEGKITLNGIDIWNIPNNEYYGMLGAVFQDYKNFAFSFAENIALTEEPNKERIQDIFGALGMTDLIKNAPSKLDTCISKRFDVNGIEVSGGEAQKIAFARAVYKNAPIFILDEPTASLDAKAENELYTDFLELSRGKTVLFISHRLAISTLADNIAVFNGGRLVEHGNHRDLMQLGGLYAEMFEKQSRPYVEKMPIF